MKNQSDSDREKRIQACIQKLIDPSNSNPKLKIVDFYIDYRKIIPRQPEQEIAYALTADDRKYVFYTRYLVTDE